MPPSDSSYYIRSREYDRWKAPPPQSAQPNGIGLADSYCLASGQQIPGLHESSGLPGRKMNYGYSENTKPAGGSESTDPRFSLDEQQIERIQKHQSQTKRKLNSPIDLGLEASLKKSDYFINAFITFLEAVHPASHVFLTREVDLSATEKTSCLFLLSADQSVTSVRVMSLDRPWLICCNFSYDSAQFEELKEQFGLNIESTDFPAYLQKILVLDKPSRNENCENPTTAAGRGGEGEWYTVIARTNSEMVIYENRTQRRLHFLTLQTRTTPVVMNLEVLIICFWNSCCFSHCLLDNYRREKITWKSQDAAVLLLTDKVNELEVASSALESRAEAAELQRDELRDAANSAEEELKIIERERSVLREENDKIKEQLRALEQRPDEKHVESAYKDLTQKHTALQTLVGDLKLKCNELEHVCGTKSAEIEKKYIPQIEMLSAKVLQCQGVEAENIELRAQIERKEQELRKLNLHIAKRLLVPLESESSIRYGDTSDRPASQNASSFYQR